MSTRSQWSFREKGKQIALIYKHSDGYPDGFHGGFALWKRFTDKIVKDAVTSNYGNRFDDAEYLAARFVVFLAVYENKENNLAFGGIGISKELHGDIEYLYEIDCDNEKVPVLRCKSVYGTCYVDSNNKPFPFVNKPTYTDKYIDELGNEIVKPKGSITIKNKTFNSLNDVKVLMAKQIAHIGTYKNKKPGSNDSHLKLKRNSLGHFIKMDNIAEFFYPHGRVNQFRIVKIVTDTNNTIEGVQCNGKNTGYKRFDKSKIMGLYQHKGYIKAGDWS